MATVKEQYDEVLDDLDPEEQMGMINHRPFARILEEIDPVQYNVGLADFEPTCEECGERFVSDDTDGKAVCWECQEDEDE